MKKLTWLEMFARMSAAGYTYRGIYKFRPPNRKRRQNIYRFDYEGGLRYTRHNSVSELKNAIFPDAEITAYNGGCTYAPESHYFMLTNAVFSNPK